MADSIQNTASADLQTTQAKADSGKAHALHQKSIGLQYSKPDSALVYAQKALKFADANLNPDLFADITKTIGVIYYIKADYDEALQYFVESTQIFRETGNLKELTRTLNNQGLIYGAFDEHKKALELYKEALPVALQVNDTSQVAKIFYNMGISHVDLEDYQKARKNFNTSLQISRQQNDSLTIARNLAFIAETHIKQQKPQQAKPLLDEAMHYVTSRDIWDMAFVKAGMAKYHLAVNQWDQAINYGEESYQHAAAINAKWELQRTTEILAKAYENIGDYKKALEFQKEHTKWNKEIYNQTRQQNLSRLQIAQQTAQNARLTTQNKLNEQKLYQERLQNMILIISVLFIGVVAIWGYRNTKRFRKLNKELSISNEIIHKAKERIERKNMEQKKLIETKNRILSIISHDARGPISSLQTLIDFVEDRDMSAGELKNLLQSVRSNLNQTIQMFDNMMHWARSQFDSFKPDIKNVEICPVAQTLLNECSQNFIKKNVALINNLNCDTKVQCDKELLIIVLRNLLSNALKFTEPGDRVTLEGKMLYKNHFAISVVDTGIGLNQDEIDKIMSDERYTQKGTHNELGAGFGLTICQNFTELMGGEFSITGTPGEGAKATLILPVGTKMKVGYKRHKNKMA